MTIEERNNVESWKNEALDDGTSFTCDKIRGFLSYKTCEAQRRRKANPTCATCEGPPKTEDDNIVVIVRYEE